MPAEVDDLQQASQMVAKVTWGDEPAVVVGEAIEAMHRSRNRTDAGLLLAVRSFSARGEHRVDGHVNVAAYLQHACGLKKREALRLARLSRFLDHQPVLEAAMVEGRISMDHLDLFADVHRERHAAAWAEAFPLLVDYATVARFEDVARQAQRFADDLSPRDADDRFTEQVEGRSFSKASTIDGFGHLQGFLDPITYAIFAAEHDRLVAIEYQNDLAIARDVLGRDPDPLELAQITRTPTQRSADAVRVMAQRSKTLAGGAVAAAAEVVIHMTQDHYEAGVARDLGDPDATPDPDGFCELDDGTPISPIAAVYLATIADFRRIVYGADDEIINYSRARRGYTPPQYGALRAKYRRCAHPWGCDRKGRFLQADHIQEHSDGGPTDCTNGQCLCGFHNRWKTRHKHDPPRSTKVDTGARRTRPPDRC